MSREYPRFIYSDPYIVHLLPPKMICKIIPDKKEYFTIDILEVFDKDARPDEIKGVIKAMRKWAINKTGLLIV